MAKRINAKRRQSALMCRRKDSQADLAISSAADRHANQKQLDAVVDLMALLANKYQVPLDKIAGHKDYSAQTVCPGTNLYRYLQNGYFRQQAALRLARK
jgi:vacuolar-type H+-ATPase subunit E/Vma4